jgi:hypothetical protein
MCTAHIGTIQGLIAYVKKNSSWQTSTIRNIITALGYNPADETRESLKELSGNLADCSKHGADGGFSGFIYHSETIVFFLHNRRDIIKNLDLLAEELGEDLIKMFRVSACSAIPYLRQRGK